MEEVREEGRGSVGRGQKGGEVEGAREMNGEEYPMKLQILTNTPIGQQHRAHTCTLQANISTHCFTAQTNTHT